MTSSADDGKHKARQGKAGREDRLAAKLRQNLVRRKAQRRSRDQAEGQAPAGADTEDPKNKPSS